MNWVRLWLACTWLIFAASAPAHAASMRPTHDCDHMVQSMDMPHTPAQPAPAHDDGLMPCCAVPALLATEIQMLQPGRRIISVRLLPAPVPHLRGQVPTTDLRPPKTSEA